MQKVAQALTKGVSTAVGKAATAFTMPPLPPFLHPDRVKYLNNKAPRPISTLGDSAGGSVSPSKTPVLYWMQVGNSTHTRQ